MKNTFKLICTSSTKQNTSFNIFNPKGSKCGRITISTIDVAAFIGYEWSGLLKWNGHRPQERTP